MIGNREYLEFVRHEYLDGFVAQGGAAVKFAVTPDDESAADLEQRLRTLAQELNYVYASVNAATTKLSMVDRVFHAMARQIPWDELAHTVAAAELNELRFPLPPGEPLSLEAIARYNRYDFQFLRRDFNQRLLESILRNYDLAHEFRIAMILLCQAQVSPAPGAQTTARSVHEWLRGELRHIAQLRPDLIYQRIVRNNALHMLYSLGPWVRKAGKPGLVLHLDIRQCAVTSKAQATGEFYTKPAVLDVYELLRQLIDATDELSSTLIVVTAGKEFLNDPVRGLEKYWALRLRILDEVRDRTRTNPYSSLIRLGSVSRAVEVTA